MSDTLLNQMVADFEAGAEGEIVHWQTTYVDIVYRLRGEPGGGRQCRIRFRGKQSFHLQHEAFSTLTVGDTHPLLLEFNAPIKTLYVATPASDADALVMELEQVWRQTFGNWKQPSYGLSRLSENGPRFFYHGPAPFVEAVLPLLEQHGMEPTLIGGSSKVTQCQILLLGRYHVIAEQFRADALEAEMYIEENYQRHIPMWVEAIESGYLTEPAWIAWAEAHVLSDEPTLHWLVDLYQATDKNAALAILYAAYPALCGSEMEVDPASANLGFLYRRYRKGELTLDRFLSLAGSVADQHNYNHPSCESIYDLLNRYEAAVEQRQIVTHYEQEADTMFERHQKYVSKWLHARGIA